MIMMNEKEPQPLKVAAENDQFSSSWIYDYPQILQMGYFPSFSASSSAVSP